MSFETNPYYYPDRHGLRRVAQYELSEPSWSFDTLACWVTPSGDFYLGTDSGCSCPIPFENYRGIHDMTGPLTREQALEESKNIRKSSYEPNYDPEGWKRYKNAIREA